MYGGQEIQFLSVWDEWVAVDGRSDPTGTAWPWIRHSWNGNVNMDKRGQIPWNRKMNGREEWFKFDENNKNCSFPVYSHLCSGGTLVGPWTGPLNDGPGLPFEARSISVDLDLSLRRSPCETEWAQA